MNINPVHHMYVCVCVCVCVRVCVHACQIMQTWFNLCFFSENVVKVQTACHATNQIFHHLLDSFSAGQEVAVVYFRAGYVPDNYPTEKVSDFGVNSYYMY